MDTEKITINLGAIDLGQIDMLVEQSFYTNRSDFIRTAIRNQLTVHTRDIQDFKVSGMLGLDMVVSEADKALDRLKSELDEAFVLDEKFSGTGVFVFDRESLEQVRASGKKIRLKMVGMLVIDKSVSKELILETFKSVKVYGIIKAPNEIREALLSLS